MDSIFLVSLTPDFSRVSGATPMTEPFQRFSVMRKAVETADDSLGTLSTWLKPGVNGSGIFLGSSAV